MSVDLRAQLEELLDLIHQERDLAKANDAKGLMAVVSRKEALLDKLPGVPSEELDEDLIELASQIRSENRRNAYLVWSALNAIRSTMEFFQKQFSPAAYGGAGKRIHAPTEGLILSGRV